MIALLLAALVATPHLTDPPVAPIKVVTSLTTYAAIARELVILLISTYNSAALTACSNTANTAYAVG